MNLLSTAESNTKLRKSETELYSVVGLSLPSHTIGASQGEKTACQESTRSCRDACVVSSAGMTSVFPRIMAARVLKREFLFSNRKAFIEQLNAEIALHRIKSESEDKILVCRLNVGTDLMWEDTDYGGIPQRHPTVVFYDYTKRHHRINPSLPSNYTLCGSWSEAPRHQQRCIELLHDGKNCAVVFSDITPRNSEGQPNRFAGNAALRQRLPKRIQLPGDSQAWNVHDGDSSDLRLQVAGDPGPHRKTGRGSVIGLRLKAHSRQVRDAATASGFTVNVDWTGNQ